MDRPGDELSAVQDGTRRQLKAHSSGRGRQQRHQHLHHLELGVGVTWIQMCSVLDEIPTDLSSGGRQDLRRVGLIRQQTRPRVDGQPNAHCLVLRVDGVLLSIDLQQYAPVGLSPCHAVQSGAVQQHAITMGTLFEQRGVVLHPVEHKLLLQPRETERRRRYLALPQRLQVFGRSPGEGFHSPDDGPGDQRQMPGGTFGRDLSARDELRGELFANLSPAGRCGCPATPCERAAGRSPAPGSCR